MAYTINKPWRKVSAGNLQYYTVYLKSSNSYASTLKYEIPFFFLKKLCYWKAENFGESKLMLHLADKTLANLSLAPSHFKYIVSESPNSPDLYKLESLV